MASLPWTETTKVVLSKLEGVGLLKKSERQVRNPGDMVRIGLGDGFHAYARVLKDAMFAIYDAHVSDTEALPIATFYNTPILFYVAVMDYAVKRGRWKIIGNISSDILSIEGPPRFIQEPIGQIEFQHLSRWPDSSRHERGMPRSRKNSCLGPGTR
jgi:hypothetical protein